MAAVDAATRVEPDSPRVMLARAYVLLRQKRIDDGIWWALRARERHPNDFAPTLRLALAQILETGGRREAAEQEYAAILKQAPRNWIAANNLAWMYAADGRLDEAMRLARVASAEAPDNPQVKNTIETILKRKSG
jgi:Flp pilus assembly protein TadD